MEYPHYGGRHQTRSNQPPGPESPYSETQVEKGNQSNATKQPGNESRGQQSGQQTQQKPKKHGHGRDSKEEPQKAGTGKH